MASAIGRPQKEKVDGVAHRRKRELQVVRAEGQACRAAASDLCGDMVKRRAELDSAADEYRRRKAELVEREAEAHGRLAEVLRDRSAAESALQDVRDHAENALKARRTASTVRAYRLDARWRRLHGRYRGFVADVLAEGGDGRGSDAAALRQLRPSDAPRPAAGRPGRRFYAAADNVSARHRRESLRTSRSLHTLMAGYLRETSDGGGGDGGGCDARTSPAADRRRGTPRPRPSVALDGASPELVLDKLRVMQEQCARVAERVRRRTARTGADAGAGPPTGRPVHASDADDYGAGHAAHQSDLLAEARQRLTAGRRYVAELRALMDRAVARASREQLALRRLLCKTCAICASGPARPNDGGGGGGDNALVRIAGRLERACFVLFARLDGVGAGSAVPSQQQQLQRDRRSVHAHDVVTTCLLAVQAHRMRTVQEARDIEHRVHNFHKAVNRLLLATWQVAPGTGPGGDRSARGRRVRRNASPGARPTTASAARRPVPKKVQKQTFVSAGSSPKAVPALADTRSVAATAESTATADVWILCPPSIGVT